MSVGLAKDWVDLAYTSNSHAVQYIERCITSHIILVVVVGALALIVNTPLALIEVYALPALGYFIKQHVLTTRLIVDILGKANDTLDKVNSQLLIEQRILELREAAKQRSK